MKRKILTLDERHEYIQIGKLFRKFVRKKGTVTIKDFLARFGIAPKVFHNAVDYCELHIKGYDYDHLKFILRSKYKEIDINRYGLLSDELEGNIS